MTNGFWMAVLLAFLLATPVSTGIAIAKIHKAYVMELLR